MARGRHGGRVPPLVGRARPVHEHLRLLRPPRPDPHQRPRLHDIRPRLPSLPPHEQPVVPVLQPLPRRVPHVRPRREPRATRVAGAHRRRRHVGAARSAARQRLRVGHRLRRRVRRCGRARRLQHDLRREQRHVRVRRRQRGRGQRPRLRVAAPLQRPAGDEPGAVQLRHRQSLFPQPRCRCRLRSSFRVADVAGPAHRRAEHNRRPA
mmetsp:Transcript_22260/g.69088  ORF Transcript_22260/g.69088 Transcript_22260/m.69088 type:complete len:208 (-) Transcript_22260:359-982(-)